MDLDRQRRRKKQLRGVWVGQGGEEREEGGAEEEGEEEGEQSKWGFAVAIY